MNNIENIHDRKVGLCDCNNFFVSCERTVNPALEGLPVVVLSSNDGCVVSRSNEAKALKIPMGAPYFKFKNFFKAYNVQICSGNMPLYQEISRNVMSVLSEYTDNLEQYSVDEAFLNLAILAVTDPVTYCAKIRADVLKRCKIPISIGIAPNKTLAKLAAEYAKKHAETGGVFWFDKSRYGSAEFMSQFTLGDVWGIGRQNVKKLEAAGITGINSLTAFNENEAKAKFGTPMLTTIWALQGKAAEHKTRNKNDTPKSIQVSRSFGEKITKYGELLDAVQNFTVAAARQLRAANSGAKKLRVYIRSGSYEQREYQSAEVTFDTPQSLDASLMSAARKLLEGIYQPGTAYTKAGIEIPYLCSQAECEQQLLFEEKNETRTAAEKAADAINKELGISIMKPAQLYAAPNEVKRWKPKHEHGDEKHKKLRDTNGMRFASHAEDV